jgi:hypothetical protein
MIIFHLLTITQCTYAQMYASEKFSEKACKSNPTPLPLKTKKKTFPVPSLPPNLRQWSRRQFECTHGGLNTFFTLHGIFFSLKPRSSAQNKQCSSKHLLLACLLCHKEKLRNTNSHHSRDYIMHSFLCCMGD